jgi:SAM-dependent methyltransferase
MTMADTNNEIQQVAAGYDVVYSALPHSATFARIWREHAAGADFPQGFEHISFVTLTELRRMADELQLSPDALLVDLACGMGGPGLWIAREAGARLRGIDISAIAVAAARRRAEERGLSQVSEFSRGNFAETELAAAVADGVMSIDALLYAPDKRDALREMARILRPGGRLVFACFEVEPARVAGLPVLGTDPVADYAAMLEAAGFDVLSYDETTAWRERMTSAYQAVIAARTQLVEEMGEAAFQALFGEMSITLQLQPYRRRVLVVAMRR